jgi:hypothetical protein
MAILGGEIAGLSSHASPRPKLGSLADMLPYEEQGPSFCWDDVQAQKGIQFRFSVNFI